MDLLKEKILTMGQVLSEEVLKVDSFLNHQIDISLYEAMGEEFKRIFSDTQVDRILTIEASGIGIACMAAHYFRVPVVYAKKTTSKIMQDEAYEAEVFSFTKNCSYTVRVLKPYIKPGENVLVIDDFLANGQAVLGLKQIIEEAGATLAGVGIVIEKGFQDGGKKLREMGIRVESLAVIGSMSRNGINFL